MSQEQQRPKAPSEACTVPLSVPPVEIPPTEEVLAKIKAALSKDSTQETAQPRWCQCHGCKGKHTATAEVELNGHWFCMGCAAERASNWTKEF